MSARAAWRLESLGVGDVYDYVAGKVDWGAAGLPLEGTIGARAGSFARADVPTCSLHEPLDAVRARVRAAGWKTCVVTNEAAVVLGRLGRRALDGDGDGDGDVEQVMAAGPSTVRPSLPLDELRERMRRRDLQHAIVTRSDGTLVGVVRREDVEQEDAAP